MNRTLLPLLLLMLASCGYSHVNNELIGQPKSIEATTPIFCPNQNILHLSLGVMRNGVGSMSTEDVRISIPDDNLAIRLQPVVKAGKLINAQTNEARFRWCNEEKELVAFEIVEDAPLARPKD
jgi:hypothetical protein